MWSSHMRRSRAKRSQPSDFVSSTNLHLSDDEDVVDSTKTGTRRVPRKGRSKTDIPSGNTFPSSAASDDASSFDDSAIEYSTLRRKTSTPRMRRSNDKMHVPKLRNKRKRVYSSEEEDDPDQADQRLSSRGTSHVSSKSYPSPISQPLRRKQCNRGQLQENMRRPRASRSTSSGMDFLAGGQEREGLRRSDRSGRAAVSMVERGEDDIWAEYDDQVGIRVPKAIGVQEAFRSLPMHDSFRHIHSQRCDACEVFGDSSDRGPLIFCQGCTVSYHQICLGPRNQREHLVTKVADQDFVLQCRHCIRAAENKDARAPRQDLCAICREAGPACQPFRKRKSPKQEEKEHEENGVQDPTIDVEPAPLNNVHNVLFRCGGCRRLFHFDHLPSRCDKRDKGNSGLDGDPPAERRFAEYCGDWRCLECYTMPAKVQGLVAWRPTHLNNYTPGQTADMISEDDKEYLIKWHKLSYFRVSWMPGAWVWGSVSVAMKKAFGRKDDGYGLPQMTAEEAIPEEFLRVDIVLDVRYNGFLNFHSEEVERARVTEVDEAFVKFKGLGYEEVVWEKVPGPQDGIRWNDYVAAYEDWVLGRYIHQPNQLCLKERLDRVRPMDFQSKLLKQKQPDNLTGGRMMDYQLEGLNWAYYKWFRGQNAILADEMGLGKTIQIIGLMATLVHDHGCWPFLIVVPNSTCPNWKREIKQWAPSLRVVAYYGSTESRKLAMEHELYPEGSGDLRCHIVVTSYETAIDDGCKRFFKGVTWAGLVVDEGQRLKNDRTLLYEALDALKTPFKILLTGTPLQNNARELFNLLQFLDKDIKASRLEEEYTELTNDSVARLHGLIRPFFLRRTKAQVLDFLPPMAQIIVPVSMSVVQKKLYKFILAKNSNLIASIHGQHKTRRAERLNLNNILMQLRKCLCHPFVYSQAIEERNTNATLSHRTLVEASSKLQLLEIMLPKLKERGHRVLIFSQFLSMLDIIEDFLFGLGLLFKRLDGNIGTLEKQKRIDAFNSPNSPLFAFLLSTRAGGVGINLATADTVIIMDPDFNPHQDMQASSRAHRIGQKKKVLVFQLMTRGSVEEKILQTGRKKMALDHILVEQMDAGDDAGGDLETILRHGAAALFNNDDKHDIHYDSEAVEKLLDRSQAEKPKVGKDGSAGSQFSFARIWANEHDELRHRLEEAEAPKEATGDTVWVKILKDRENAARERVARQETFGRGKRKRQAVEYKEVAIYDLDDVPSSLPPAAINSSNEPDFEAKIHDVDNEYADDEVTVVRVRKAQSKAVSAASGSLRSSGGTAHAKSTPSRPPPRPSRAKAPTRPPAPAATPRLLPTSAASATMPTTKANACPACTQRHPAGYCPLKLAGADKCPLCGIVHFGDGPVCPHLRSEQQVRAMMAAVERNAEAQGVREAALAYLRRRLACLARQDDRGIEKAEPKETTKEMTENMAEKTAKEKKHAGEEERAVEEKKMMKKKLAEGEEAGGGSGGVALESGEAREELVGRHGVSAPNGVTQTPGAAEGNH